MHNYQNENKCLSQIKKCGLKQGFGTYGGCKQCKVNKPSEDDLKKKTMDGNKNLEYFSLFSKKQCALSNMACNLHVRNWFFLVIVQPK